MPVRNAVQILIVVAVYMHLVILLGNNVIMCSLTYPCLSLNGRLLVIISSGNHLSVIQTGTYHDIIAYTLMIMFIVP